MIKKKSYGNEQISRENISSERKYYQVKRRRIIEKMGEGVEINYGMKKKEISVGASGFELAN